jgi:hypothetical protein
MRDTPKNPNAERLFAIRGHFSSLPTSSCIPQADADAMNGDVKSVQSNLEKIIPPEICKISNLKVEGSKIVYSATCGGQPARVVTTIYAHAPHRAQRKGCTRAVDSVTPSPGSVCTSRKPALIRSSGGFSRSCT